MASIENVSHPIQAKQLKEMLLDQSGVFFLHAASNELGRRSAFLTGFPSKQHLRAQWVRLTPASLVHAETALPQGLLPICRETSVLPARGRRGVLQGRPRAWTICSVRCLWYFLDLVNLFFSGGQHLGFIVHNPQN